MSLFGGILSLDHPPEQAHVERLAKVLRASPHAQEIPFSQAGLRGVFLQRYTTPQSRKETGPISRGGWMLMGEMRLDAREELGRALGLSPSEVQASTDPELALAAFLRWGDAFAERLYGAFAMALWHAGAQKLVLAVDHLACMGLTYAVRPEGLAFSNHLPATRAAAPDPNAVNERYLLKRFLMLAEEDPSTVYRDVMRVPPGHVLVAERGQPIRTTRYWFPTRIPPHRHRSERETLEGFLDVYTRAVEDRLRVEGPVATHLSGGLDSGTVTALAAELVKQRGERLTAFTGTALHVSERYKNRFEDEAAVAALTAEHLGNVDQVVFACPNTSVVDSVRFAVDRLGNLGHGIGNLFWIFEISAYARDHGYPVVLNGQVGNMSVSWKGASWAERGRDWGKKQHERLEALLTDRARWRTPLTPNVEIPGCFARAFDYSHLHPDFLARFTTDDLLQRPEEALDHERIPLHVAPNRYSLLRPRASGLGMFWQTLGHVFGITNWDPTDDRRLIEYTLGIPEAFFLRGMGRHLVRAAFKGRLPDAVRLNRAKGIQSPDRALRLVPEVPRILRLIDALPPDHPAHGVLHLPTLRASFADLAQNPEAYHLTSGALMRHLGYLFLTGAEG